jgi:ankyrin repeat protein
MLTRRKAAGLSMPAADTESSALAQLLERVAALPLLTLVLVLRHLPTVELARLTFVHKAFWLALASLREQHAGARYARPTSEDLNNACTFSRLSRAALYGDVAIIASMVAAGVSEHGTPLLQAFESPLSLMPLLDHALFQSVKKGHVQAAELLLDAGADLHGCAGMLLCLAADEGHANMVAMLLLRGANVKAEYGLSLILASKNGRLDIMALLIERGADVNGANNGNVRSRTHRGELIRYSTQPICSASQYGQAAAVALLIQHGAHVHTDINAALRTACHKGHLEVVKLLVSHGADIHAANQRPLFLAFMFGHADIVAFLIERGCPDVTDQFEHFETRRTFLMTLSSTT